MENSHSTYGELYRQVESNKDQLQIQKDKEMKKVSEVFRKLRLALDRREVELKTEYSERIREHFTFMNKESIKLRYIFGELDKLYTNINKL